MFVIGEHVRIVEPGTGQLGRVVVIRAYRTLCPGIRWPCFEGINYIHGIDNGGSHDQRDEEWTANFRRFYHVTRKHR